MTQEDAMNVGRQCLWIIAQLAAPIVGVGLIVGVAISVFQAATQIQEQSLVFVPKVLAVLATLAICGGWMMTRVVEFTRTLLLSLPDLVR